MIERTFAMVKPDAYEKRVVGRVLSRIEDECFRIVRMEQRNLSLSDAGRFYAEHAGRPFFGSLCAFMSSGPVLAMVLERDAKVWRGGAVAHWREVLGATDSRRAVHNTLRERHGDKTGSAIWRNVAHGSDSRVAAVREIACFFDFDGPVELSESERVAVRALIEKAGEVWAVDCESEYDRLCQYRSRLRRAAGIEVSARQQVEALQQERTRKTCSKCKQWFVDGHGFSVVGPCLDGDHDWQEGASAD